MYPKLVIFVAISAFLIVAVYSSSVPRVFAKEICNVSVGDPLTLYCTDTVKETVYLCEYTITGLHCYYPHIIDKIPAALKEALDHATQESQNNTKVPIIDRLHVGSLKQDINTNNTNADVKVPKGPKVPGMLGALNDTGG